MGIWFIKQFSLQSLFLSFPFYKQFETLLGLAFSYCDQPKTTVMPLIHTIQSNGKS